MDHLPIPEYVFLTVAVLSLGEVWLPSLYTAHTCILLMIIVVLKCQHQIGCPISLLLFRSLISNSYMHVLGRSKDIIDMKIITCLNVPRDHVYKNPAFCVYYMILWSLYHCAACMGQGQ